MMQLYICRHSDRQFLEFPVFLVVPEGLADQLVHQLLTGPVHLANLADLKDLADLVDRQYLTGLVDPLVRLVLSGQRVLLDRQFPGGQPGLGVPAGLRWRTPWQGSPPGSQPWAGDGEWY